MGLFLNNYSPFQLTCKRFPKNIAKCYEKHQAARQGFTLLNSLFQSIYGKDYQVQ